MGRNESRGPPPKLGNVHPGYHVLIECAACGHSVRADVPALVAKYGAETTWPELRDKLVCSSCGARRPYTLFCLNDPPPMW